MKILGNWGARKESVPLKDSNAFDRNWGNSGANSSDGEQAAQVLRDRLMSKTANDKPGLSDRDADPLSTMDRRQDGPSVQSADSTQGSERPMRSAWDLPAEDGASQYIGASETPLKPVARNYANAADTTGAKSATPSADGPSKAARTRLIGFDKSDGSSVDVFEQKPGTVSGNSVFPVGWIVVIEGPGRGHAFTLHSGLSQIGRNDDQAVALNFGDMAISRSNHAAIVFDVQSSTFMMGHGGKANIVRLNGKPVIANEEVRDGDMITIGETTLQLKAFCGADFTWEEREPETPEILSIV